MDLRPFLVTLLCLCANAQLKSDCGVDGNPGQCVVLNKCDVLLSKRRDKDFFKILRAHYCGYEHTDPKVCCPEPVLVSDAKSCRTPDGNEGTCTRVKDCNDSVYPWMFRGLPDDTCNSPESNDTVHVCCKSKASSSFATSPETLTKQDNRFLNQCVLSAFPPPPDSLCCGVSGNGQTKIIDGKIAAIDQFPWLVLIDYTRPQLSCGGSLISGRYVLTAAHCLVGSKGNDRGAVSVRIGEYNKTNPGPDCVISAGGGQDCTEGHITNHIESYVIHEDYNPDHVFKNNDIALIRLKDIVKYTDFSRPICLPASDFTKPSPPSNLTLLISGWGIVNSTTRISSDVKIFANVTYMDKEDCTEMFFKRGIPRLGHAQVCVGGHDNKDSCEGDSGGPLMLKKNLVYEAEGVISFGFSYCGLRGWPSIYMKVYDYLNWIMANIKP